MTTYPTTRTSMRFLAFGVLLTVTVDALAILSYAWAFTTTEFRGFAPFALNLGLGVCLLVCGFAMRDQITPAASWTIPMALIAMCLGLLCMFLSGMTWNFSDSAWGGYTGFCMNFGGGLLLMVAGLLVSE